MKGLSQAPSSSGGHILRGLKGQAQWTPVLSHRGHCPTGASAPTRASWPPTLPGRVQAQGYRDVAFSLQVSGSQSQAKGQLPLAVPELAPLAEGLF